MYTNLPAASKRVATMLAQARSRMDKYCFFKWNNLEAWDNFHAFIIADKAGDLKFHTGPSFSNSYSSPQFGTNNNLLGVKFSTASVSFKVGFYYITEENWRQILQVFNPYEVAWLEFGYDTKWRYQCKVNKIAEASRYILEEIGGEDYYYAETTLTFDLVGEPVAYTQPYEFTESIITPANEDPVKVFKRKTTIEDYTESDLDYPLDISVNLNLSRILENSSADPTNSFTLTCKTGYGDCTYSFDTQLFEINFQNISYSSVTTKDENTESHWPAFLTVKYRSDTGVILQLKGEQESLLSLQQSTASGNRLVRDMTSQPYKWSGNYYTIVPSDGTSKTDPFIYIIIKNGKGTSSTADKIVYFNKNDDTYGEEWAKVYISGCGLTRAV